MFLALATKFLRLQTQATNIIAALSSSDSVPAASTLGTTLLRLTTQAAIFQEL